MDKHIAKANNKRQEVHKRVKSEISELCYCHLAWLCAHCCDVERAAHLRKHQLCQVDNLSLKLTFVVLRVVVFAVVGASDLACSAVKHHLRHPSGVFDISHFCDVDFFANLPHFIVLTSTAGLFSSWYGRINIYFCFFFIFAVLHCNYGNKLTSFSSNFPW